MSKPEAPVVAPAPTTPNGASKPAPVTPAAPPTNSGPTISQQLFPDYIAPDGNFASKPMENFVPATSAAPTPPTPATPAPQPTPVAPPATPEYLDLTSLQGKLVKTVIDGVEHDIPADQAFKSIQLERHLTQKAQRLAAQEKELQERAKNQRLAPPASATDDDDDAPLAPAPAHKSAEVLALEQRLQQQEAAINQLMQVAAPFQQQTVIANLDAQVRSETGATDFLEYLPKVQRAIQERSTSPEEFRAAVQNPGALLYIYQQMKIRDLNQRISGAQGQQPGVAVPAPAQTPRAPAPVVPPIEGGGGSPGTGLEQETQIATANKLFNQAVNSGREQDWTAYLAHKRTWGAE